MLTSDMNRFTESCNQADKFPRNLVQHETYEHNLLTYYDRLDEREEELFSEEPEAFLDLLEYDGATRKRKSVVTHNTKELKDHIHISKANCRFVFLHAPNSRARLYTSRKLLTYILTYYQVMPSFLDFIFPFGRQEHARDMYFSGFREESNLRSAHGGMKLPELGRSGREVRMSYNLKSMEPSGQTHMPWSLRQVAIYHSLDVETGKEFWVVVKGDELIKERIEDIIDFKGGLVDSTNRTPAEDGFAASLATHLIISDWCSENWRWYLSDLEESLRAKTGRTLAVVVEVPEISKVSKSVTWSEKSSSPVEKRPSRSFSNLVGKSFSRASTKIEEDLTLEPESTLTLSPPPPPPPPASPSRSNTKAGQTTPEKTASFSFNSLQQIQHVEDKANEVALILGSDISVLAKLQDHYEVIGRSSLFQEKCGYELEMFQKRMSGIINDLRMQESRTAALLRLLADRKSLLYGILQYQSMETSKVLATRAQESTENMEAMTEDMHTLALRTKQETVSMRIITLVTLFFLPGTFISVSHFELSRHVNGLSLMPSLTTQLGEQTIMSTDIVKFETDDRGISQKVFHLDALQLFMMIALPLMLSTFAAWYGVYWWIDRKEEMKRSSELAGSEKRQLIGRISAFEESHGIRSRFVEGVTEPPLATLRAASPTWYSTSTHPHLTVPPPGSPVSPVSLQLAPSLTLRSKALAQPQPILAIPSPLPIPLIREFPTSLFSSLVITACPRGHCITKYSRILLTTPIGSWSSPHHILPYWEPSGGNGRNDGPVGTHQRAQLSAAGPYGWPPIHIRTASYFAKEPHQIDECAAFTPISAVTSHLEEDGRLEDILDALFQPDGGPEADILLPNYVAIFCILIEIGKGTAIEHFVRQGLNDKHLPFDPQHAPADFPPDTSDGTFYQRFCEMQWRFCVPDFERGVERVFHNRSLLPIVKKRAVAEGGSAKLFEIEVHSSYNKLRPESCAKDDPIADVFAVKTYYTPDAERYYKTEVEAFRKLKRSQPHNPHLISFFGSYIHSGTYNIILEFADQGSLEQYFQTIDPPSKIEDISKLWASLFGIIKGIDSIHNVELAKPNAGFGILNGYHQDIKPRNILVFSNNSSSPYEFTFKLADLGLSHFQQTVDGETTAPAADSYGTSTYGAPECHRSDDFWDHSPLRVKQDVDIWSIGCVYSEVAVWMARSSSGLKEYRKLRLDTTVSTRIGDAFHDGQKVLDAVSRTHTELLPELRIADCVTPGVLQIIDEGMLLPPGVRLDTRQLWARLESKLPHSEGFIHAGSRSVPLVALQASSQRPQSTRESIKFPTPYSSPTPPPPPGPRPHYPRITGGRRMTDPKFGSGNANFQPYYPRKTPTLPYPRASSPEMLPISEYEGHKGKRADENSSFSGEALTEEPRGYSTPPSRTSSQFRGPLEVLVPPFFGAHGQPPISSPATIEKSVPQHAEDPFVQQSVDDAARSIEAVTYAGNSNGQGETDRPGLMDHYHSSPTPTTLDGPRNRGGEWENMSKRPTSHNPQVNQRPQVNKRPHSLPASQLPPSVTGSSHELDNKSNCLSNKRSPLHGSHQRKKPRRSSNFPHLALATAIQWRMDKKESENWMNKFRKREVPRLPGDWLMHKCHKRDHVFIIDDASSMKNHWDEMSILFGVLAYIVKKSDDDGIDLYFSMSETRHHHPDTKKLIEVVNRRKSHLEGHSSINVRLQHVLGEYNTKLRNQIALRRSGNPHIPFRDIKPLSVYVFTDGVWTPRTDPQPAIESIVGSLEELNANPGQVGIQFISFGQDPKPLERLERLDKGLKLKRDIVDHCPSNEGLWKMIFGAIDPEFDEADDSDSDQGPSNNKEFE
ncbi:hypothetical protein HYFRA_00009625 [Hymenoscyphus fraxineus]|uniref:Protein kinase domain-containing protein n=1 Tax=Hymenoscyphus fraxineus TaxID=746836 RepID=A0A9N9PMM6_9HELO|nr:hypothetical protein HYFRA_00009625 [Hymenoscyphus fraxineus]